MSRFSYLISRRLSTAVFDRQLKKRQRGLCLNLPDGAYYDYLREESARQIVDRIEDITRKFPVALELGSYRGALAQHISDLGVVEGKGGVGGIQKLVQCDLAPLPSALHKHSEPSNSHVESYAIQVDEEFLPFKQDSFDLVLSSLNLHWVNDLPASLLQIKNVLKPDGAFIASFLGGDTLTELRHCFFLAEQERKGGMSVHTSPMVRGSDVASLMQGAGFSLPTIDVEKVSISYPNAFALLEHVHRMGEGHASIKREFSVGRDVFLSMAALYQHLYGLEDGSVSATFEIIYAIGWKPHDSQPKACRRGSAKVSMKTIGQQD